MTHSVFNTIDRAKFAGLVADLQSTNLSPCGLKSASPKLNLQQNDMPVIQNFARGVRTDFPRSKHRTITITVKEANNV